MATANNATPAARGHGYVLRLWGIDPAHIQRARDAFARYPSRNYWRITDEHIDQAPITTILAFDPNAVAQAANFGWAWAVYRAEAPAEQSAA